MARALRTDLRDTVDHLPPASVLSLDDVSWEEYQEILDQFIDPPGIRFTYDEGRLDIVTTSPGHERWKEFVQDLVSTLCQELDVQMESYGQMTQVSRQHRKGAEADTCFYVANAERMIGRDEIDVTVEPPDIVVEIDRANQSLRKFPIYAAFGVPEIWRCDIRRTRIQIFALGGEDGEDGGDGESYVEVHSSRFFPILTGEVLARFVAQSGREGRIRTLAAFREWVRAARDSQPETHSR